MKKRVTVYDLMKQVPLVFAFTLFANVGAGLVVGTWKASAHNTEYNGRLKAVEGSVNNLSDIPVRLSSIEGKMDVLLNNVLRNK